jgi:hypothetical protein
MREQGQVETLFESEITVERKCYRFALCENHLGRYVRITESSGPNGRRNAIVIPCGGLADIDRILNAMIQADSEAPACPAQEDHESVPPAYSNEGNVFRMPLRRD